MMVTIRILVAAALLACGATACSQDPGGAPSPATAAPQPQPQPQPQPSSSVDAPERRTALREIPNGSPPRIGYAVGSASDSTSDSAGGWVFHHPDGTSEPILGQAEIGLSAITPYRGGFLAADGRAFEGTIGLAVLRGRMRTELGPCATGAAVRADRTQVAWLTLGCPETNQSAPARVHVSPLSGGEGWTRVLERRSLLFAVGMIGTAVVVDGWADPVRLVPPTGAITTIARLGEVTAVAGRRGYVAGLVPHTEDHTVVVDAGTGRLLWQRPRTYALDFSPDERRLVVNYRRIPMVLEARTGRLVTRIDAPGTLDQLVWEDEEHLLGVLRHGGRQTLVRLGLDGSLQRLAPVLAIKRMKGFVLTTQP